MIWLDQWDSEGGAGWDHRSIANMIGVLIRDYCGKHGIAIQIPQATDNNRDHSA